MICRGDSLPEWFMGKLNSLSQWKVLCGFLYSIRMGNRKGNFCICEADKPEGPWKRTVFPEYLYDPGLLFDDNGKVYVVHGQHKLFVTELNADVKSVKVNR